ncbi:MAG: AsmA family protein [Flavobacteriaceae bacterium]|nr:AsmA family protein [Flavobacteriaceae bacterium]
MKKKILKITGITLLLIIALLIAIPYFFKDQINAKILESINNNVNAEVSFVEADLSLLKSFPQANVTIEKLSIVNKVPFKGDTLVYFGELNLKMSIKELFKSKEESINIEAITSKDGLINIIFNKDGIGNFDIALKYKEADKSNSKPMSLKIKEYSIENYTFQYYDESSKIRMKLDSLYHSGSGDFASSKLDLVTKSVANVSLDMDKINYMKKIPFTLDAILGIDLDKSKYTFKENKAHINKLPLEFDGFIQMVAKGQNYDLKFKTPTSSFENFLGLVPSGYSGSIKEVKTTGEFKVIGFAKGLFSDTTVPKFNVEITSNNASFQYPNLPKSVKNIVIDTKIINETGILNDTYINLDKISFKIDQDIFEAKANIRNITKNAVVDASLKGKINLSNLSKAYPIKIDKPLSGILKADVKTKFDMESVNKSNYQNIDNSGTISLTGFNYFDEKGKKMAISSAIVQFSPSRVNLQEFKATTGKSDINLSGVLDNFYGFLFKKQELKGNFNMSSNQIAVSDFLTSDEEKKENTTGSAMKIPSFLNCTLTAKANKVLYDNLTLTAVSGKLIIKDQKVTLENGITSLFGGTIAFDGNVSTKENIPNFKMELGMNQVDIQQTFTQLEMMKKIAPIAGVINGKLNSTINLSGNLDSESMTPDLKTLSGNLAGKLASTSLNPKNSNVLKNLGTNLKFLDLQQLNLNDVKANLIFKDGKVEVNPFDIKYQDIKATINGMHGFDQAMNYNIKMDVPAKYIGSEANKLIAKLSTSEANKIENIPVNALLTGSFKSPKVTTDMKSAVTNLTNQLVKQQKEKLLNQGKNTLKDLLNGSKKDTISNKKEDLKSKAEGLLKGLFK